VLKLARAEELRHAIAEALAGRSYVTPLLSDSEADEGRLVPRGMPAGGGVEALTDRQRQILKLIARGQTTADIARSIGLSEKSIEFHRARIRKTLGLKTTAALVRYAVAEKLV
jgi:DNA-binding NarL/FixJ family response regulator